MAAAVLDLTYAFSCSCCDSQTLIEEESNGPYRDNPGDRSGMFLARPFHCLPKDAPQASSFARRRRESRSIAPATSQDLSSRTAMHRLLSLCFHA